MNADLTGVTIGGRPVVEVLREEAEKRKADEVEDLMRTEQREKRRIILRSSGRGDLVAVRSRVSRRVRHLTDDEIRKEYGVDKKPFESLAEGALYLIRVSGSEGCTPHEIAAGLDVPLPKVFSTVSRLFLYMEPKGSESQDMNPLTREMVKGMYRYRWKNPETTVEHAMLLYRAGSAVAYRAKRDKKRGIGMVETVMERAEREISKLPTHTPEGVVGLIRDLTQLGMTVKVEGNVTITFRFER